MLIRNIRYSNFKLRHLPNLINIWSYKYLVGQSEVSFQKPKSLLNKEDQDRTFFLHMWSWKWISIFYLAFIESISTKIRAGLSQAGGLVGPLAPPQFLAEQLTLSRPGGQIMPTTVLRAPRIFRPCNGPAYTYYTISYQSPTLKQRLLDY